LALIYAAVVPIVYCHNPINKKFLFLHIFREKTILLCEVPFYTYGGGVFSVLRVIYFVIYLCEAINSL
jgi:hypothetical protein